MAELAAPPEPPAEEACSPSLVNRLTDAAKNLKVAAVQGAHNTDHAVQKARAVLGARDEDELLIAGDVIDAGAREAHVRLISGRGLEREGAGRRVSAYCVARLTRDELFESDRVPISATSGARALTRRPEWDETLELRPVTSLGASVKVVCFDKNAWGKDFRMGEVALPLAGLTVGGDERVGWHALADPHGKAVAGCAGELQIGLSLHGGDIDAADYVPARQPLAPAGECAGASAPSGASAPESSEAIARQRLSEVGQNLTERGEKLGGVQQKSEQLAGDAAKFAEMARALNER